MRMAYTMDGLDTLWQIRRHPAGSQAKVLIASALDGQIGDIQQKATQLGIAGWLQKPFETQDLLQRLENAG
jgi:CheY-like chemotaxis protein